MIIIAILACIFGGGIGAYAMINAKWASNLVRLVPTPGKVEGQSEFRATYGGLFMAGHAFAAWALLTQDGGALATTAIGAGWAGSSVGRLVSFGLDKTATPLNWINVAIEAAMGLALASPLLFG
jgi:hypothetical protein